MHSAGEQDVRLIKFARPLLHLEVGEYWFSYSIFLFVEHIGRTADRQQIHRPSLQAFNKQLIGKIYFVFNFLVDGRYPLPKILQEPPTLVERIRVVVGEINLLLYFNTKVKLILSIGLSSFHTFEPALFIGNYAFPSPLLLAADADAIVLFKLLILLYNLATLAKYSRIFILLIVTGITISQLLWILKWKNVFEDCFNEYWGCIGSKAGHNTNFPSITSAPSRFPESKLEVMRRVAELKSITNSLCLDCIIIKYDVQ